MQWIELEEKLCVFFGLLRIPLSGSFLPWLGRLRWDFICFPKKDSDFEVLTRIFSKPAVFVMVDCNTVKLNADNSILLSRTFEIDFGQNGLLFPGYQRRVELGLPPKVCCKCGATAMDEESLAKHMQNHTVVLQTLLKLLKPEWLNTRRIRKPLCLYCR